MKTKYILEIECLDKNAKAELFKTFKERNSFVGISINQIYKVMDESEMGISETHPISDKKEQPVNFTKKPTNLNTSFDDSLGWHEYNDVSNMPTF